MQSATDANENSEQQLHGQCAVALVIGCRGVMRRRRRWIPLVAAASGS